MDFLGRGVGLGVGRSGVFGHSSGGENAEATSRGLACVVTSETHARHTARGQVGQGAVY